MRIWKKSDTLRELNGLCKGTLLSHLEIKFTEIGDDYLKATMPVDHRTHQPMGLLHGGASVVLAESLGSTAANIAVDRQTYCVGLEVNANHIRSVTDGLVIGVAKPVHIGRTTHVWGISISDEEDNLVCMSRITMAVLQK